MVIIAFFKILDTFLNISKSMLSDVYFNYYFHLFLPLSFLSFYFLIGILQENT